MPLPSFLTPKDKTPVEPRKRPAKTPAAPADDGGPVQAARTRARRRLIGAVVLLAVGIIGFPLVFETQPRPVALDIPIEPPHGSSAAAPAPPLRPRPVTLPVVETPAEDSVEAAAAASAPSAAASVVAAVPTPKPAPPPAPAVIAPAPPVAKADDSARAKALLDNAAASVPKAGRFVVQVGAFTDAVALRDVRVKVEKLGLKTYTQVIETDAGKRTRVRIGPFATRDEADAAGAKLKAAGLPAAILTL